MRLRLHKAKKQEAVAVLLEMLAEMQQELAELEARLETMESMAHFHVPKGLVAFEGREDPNWWLHL